MSMTADELCPCAPKLLADCARESQVRGFEPTTYLNLGEQFRHEFCDWCKSFSELPENTTHRYPTHCVDYMSAGGASIIKKYEKAHEATIKRLYDVESGAKITAFRLLNANFLHADQNQLATVELAANEDSEANSDSDSDSDIEYLGTNNIYAAWVNRDFEPTSTEQVEQLMKLLNLSGIDTVQRKTVTPSSARRHLPRAAAQTSKYASAAPPPRPQHQLFNFSLLKRRFSESVLPFVNNNCFASSAALALQCMRHKLVPMLQSQCRIVAQVPDELRFLFDIYLAASSASPSDWFHEHVDLPHDHGRYSAAADGSADPAQFFAHILQSLQPFVSSELFTAFVRESQTGCQACRSSHQEEHAESLVLPLCVPNTQDAHSVRSLLAGGHIASTERAICGHSVRQHWDNRDWDAFMRGDGMPARLKYLAKINKELIEAEEGENAESAFSELRVAVAAKRRRSSSVPVAFTDSASASVAAAAAAASSGADADAADELLNGGVAAPSRSSQSIISDVASDQANVNLLCGLYACEFDPAFDIRRYDRIMRRVLNVKFGSERKTTFVLDTDRLPHFLCMEIKRNAPGMQQTAVSLTPELEIGSKHYRLVHVALNRTSGSSGHVTSLISPRGSDTFHFLDNYIKHNAGFQVVQPAQLDGFKPNGLGSNALDASHIATLLVYEHVVPADNNECLDDSDDDSNYDPCQIDDAYDSDDDRDSDDDEEEEEKKDDDGEKDANESGDRMVDDEAGVHDEVVIDGHKWSRLTIPSSALTKRPEPVCHQCHLPAVSNFQLCHYCSLRRLHNQEPCRAQNALGKKWTCSVCRATREIPEPTTTVLQSLRTMHRLRTVLINASTRLADDWFADRDPRRVHRVGSMSAGTMDVDITADASTQLFVGCGEIFVAADVPDLQLEHVPHADASRVTILHAPLCIESHDTRLFNKAVVAVAMADRGMSRHIHEIEFPFKDCPASRNRAAFEQRPGMQLTRREHEIVQYCRDNLYSRADYWGLQVRPVGNDQDRDGTKAGGERGVFLTQDMQAGTLLAIYVGEADFLAYHTHDLPLEFYDNNFVLLDTKDPRTALVLSQNHRGNIARFVNEPRNCDGAKALNATAVRRVDPSDGSVGIYFVLTKDSKCGDQVLLEYGSSFHE